MQSFIILLSFYQTIQIKCNENHHFNFIIIIIIGQNIIDNVFV